MSVVKRLSIIFLAVIVIINVLITVSYGDNFDVNAFEGSGGSVAGTGEVKTLVNNAAATAITVARIVSVTIAITMLLVIAMKYMMSAPGDRADIKKHAVHYVIGAFVLFGVTGILTVISEFATAIGG